MVREKGRLFVDQNPRNYCLIGSTLNADYGAPDTPQPRGAAVMHELAQRLQVSMSELYRMRWFAFRFESEDDFQKRHPSVRSWSRAKELLAELAKADASGKTEPRPEKKLSEEEAKKAANREAEKTRKQVMDLLSTVRDKIKDLPFDELKMADLSEVEQTLLAIVKAMEPVAMRLDLKSVLAQLKALLPDED